MPRLRSFRLAAAIAVPLVSGAAHASSFASLTNVNIANQGSSEAFVTSGAAFIVQFSYTLWSDASCPACPAQIVLGVPNGQEVCGLDLVPGVEPGMSGNGILGFTAPATPGIYEIGWTHELASDCDGADALWTSRVHTSLGTIMVGAQADNFSAVKNVNVDGEGLEAVVTTGAAFNVNLDYQVWNGNACPGCTIQLALGLDDVGQGCAFNGGPSTFPGASGNPAVPLVAPGTPGSYSVTWNRNDQFTCADALTNFANVPRKKIGRIDVGDLNGFFASIRKVNLGGKGKTYYASPGETIDLHLTFTLWNAPDCPTCQDQLVLGFDSVGQTCAFADNAHVPPGTTQNAQLPLIAPNTTGRYELRWKHELQFTCADAIGAFATGSQGPIATVFVNGILADGFESGDTAHWSAPVIP